MVRRLADCWIVMAARSRWHWMNSRSAHAKQKKTGAGIDHTYAKNTSLKPLPPGGSAPRTADGHPDFSGNLVFGHSGNRRRDAGGFLRTVGPGSEKRSIPTKTPRRSLPSRLGLWQK